MLILREKPTRVERPARLQLRPTSFAGELIPVGHHSAPILVWYFGVFGYTLIHDRIRFATHRFRPRIARSRRQLGLCSRRD